MRSEPAERIQQLTHHERFSLFQRILHGVLMVTFLGLAASGMPLRFNQARWSVDFAAAVGGFDAILFWHKALAVLLTLAFAVHLGHVAWMSLVRRQRGVFRGPTSMVPQMADVRELVAHVKWFLRRGPRPEFGRFTYWEKFDYLAVFWGMFAIGITGYVMWFSEAAARFLPGWAFNISLIIHSEEALLAVWYIFAIHFFNAHLRPGKFPMDTVIFSGRESLYELATDRPSEYRRLAESGTLEDSTRPAPPLWAQNFGHLVGTAAIVVGFALFGLTIYAFATEGDELQIEANRVEADEGRDVRLEVADTSWSAGIGEILDARCRECHGAVASGGLDVRTAAAATAGGDSGPGVVPGRPEASLLVSSQLAGDHPGDLTVSELDELTAWIANGAP